MYSDTFDSDPLRHYVRHGAAEGRNPSPIFDTGFYLCQYPDLDPRQINPLCHYILVGEDQGAWPNPYFDPAAVRRHLDTGMGSSQNTLAAFLSLGATHLSPSHRFCGETYLNTHHLAVAAAISPLSHQLTKDQLLDPNALMRPAQSRTRISAVNGMVSFGFDRGHMFFHVVDDDPYFVFSPVDEETFQTGHHRMTLSFSRVEESLHRAKLYLDRGNGFSEADTLRPGFQFDEAGTATCLFTLNENVRHIRLDPVDNQLSGSIGYGIRGISLQKIRPFEFYRSLIDGISTSQSHMVKLYGRTVIKAVRHGPKIARAALIQEHDDRLIRRLEPFRSNLIYQDWIKQFDEISDEDRQAMAGMISHMAHQPKISVVMPVYNTPEPLLEACINSVIDQTYTNWELCIADDNSTEPHVRTMLEGYQRSDDRIKVVFRSDNGHISKATNSAIDIASGEWVALLDHDDLLAPHALFCVADAINKHPDAKMFFSDEDKIDLDGHRSDPYFKSDWNERLFFEQNMVSHLGVYNADLLREAGGFRAGFEGAQDHDLVLRLVENITPDQIVHIPHILYHWRILPGSTALGASEKSYALVAGIKALQEALDRRGIHGCVEPSPDMTYYRLKLAVVEAKPLVSIIIPTRDGLDVLEPCLTSLLANTTYDNFEIIIVDNQSENEETRAYFRELEKDSRISVLAYDEPFNYSAINNFAVENSNGSLICLLNNDTEIISPEWLTEMVAELSQQNVGAVGAKLLYTDGTIQHAGVILGVGGKMGVAGHGLLGLKNQEGGYFSYAQLAREVSAVTAACLLTTREIFDEVGGLNETDLRVAFNDVDFCLKIREAGYKIIWTPHALLHHHESKTRGMEDTPEKQQRFAGEVLYMLKRWGKLLQNDPYYNPNLALDADTYLLSRPPRTLKPWNTPAS